MGLLELNYAYEKIKRFCPASEFAVSAASGIRAENISRAVRRIRVLVKRPTIILCAIFANRRLWQRMCSAGCVISESSCLSITS
jgi:hypothetical protein